MGGGDKPLRRLAGRPLLDHVLTRLRPQVGPIVINANGDPSRFKAWELPVVADPVDGHPGPLAGVLAGMLWAASVHPQIPDIVSIPGDTPFLPVDLVQRLRDMRRVTGARIVCASSAGRTHPIVALWPVVLAGDLSRALGAGVRKVDAWSSIHGVAAVAFANVPFDPFINVNSPEDLLQAEEIAANGPS